jgi:hypothetical protein
MMRLVYFKELINKFKEHHKNSTNSKAEESMMLDYLVKMEDHKNSHFGFTYVPPHHKILFTAI